MNRSYLEIKDGKCVGYTNGDKFTLTWGGEHYPNGGSSRVVPCARPRDVIGAVVERLLFEQEQAAPAPERMRAIAYLQRAQAELMLLEAKDLESAVLDLKPGEP